MEASSAFRLELFNVYQRGAQLLLQDLSTYTAIEKNNSLHIVVIGLGRMGESLVVNAARAWRDDPTSSDKILRFSIVDRVAVRKVSTLIVRYPRLTETCELIQYEMDITSPEFQSGSFLPDAQHLSEVNAICVCLDDDSLSLYTGLSLLKLTRKNAIHIFVRVSEDVGLARLLSGGEGDPGGFRNLHSFALLDRACTPDLLLGGTHEVLARAIYEDYIHHQKSLGKDLPEKEVMIPWDALPEHVKELNRRQADQIGVKLKAIGCGIAPLTDWESVFYQFSSSEIELMARMEHENWMQHLQSNGWTYAPGEKNLGQKTHPDLLSWEDLPEAEKEKNLNTVREIPRFLSRAGFQVEKRQG
jgi:hypothetical protein